MSDEAVTFHATDSLPGVVFYDGIEQRHLRLETPSPVTPTAVATDRFLFPVDAACSVETSSLSMDRLDDVNVRDGDGSFLRPVRSHQSASFDAGEYIVEISGAIKLYVEVEGPLDVTAGAESLELAFDGPTTVALGARSYHERPAGTITVTEDPEDVMVAVSRFASALKTARPERSYPTLRGHPPLVELGDELAVPDDLTPPDSGIRIVVPPDRRSVYQVASLAFYLGARVVPGEPARIETDAGFVHQLTGAQWFDDEVARTLRHLLVLDCVVRTEGFYATSLYERPQVEGYLSTDVADLYDRPPAERVAEYLRVPSEVVEPITPRWCLTAYLPDTPESVEALPFIANELGIVRPPRGRRIDAESLSVPTGAVTRLAAGGGTDPSRHLVKPEQPDDSVEHAWFGEHIPVGASKASVTAYRNKLNQTTGREDVDIVLATNGGRVLGEGEHLDEVYGRRDDLTVDVRTHESVTKAELRGILGSGCAFLHYIGDATEDGLACTDGVLRLDELDEVSLDAFLIDAPHSIEIANRLVEAGAIGGVATVGAVRQDSAVEIGQATAHLLNLGFPLRAALELVREQTSAGEQYVVVGDGGVDIGQARSSVPVVVDVSSRDDGNYGVDITTYPTREYRLGTTVTPNLDGVEQSYLSPGKIAETFVRSESAVKEYLAWHSCPVRVGGELYWNSAAEDAQL